MVKQWKLRISTEWSRRTKLEKYNTLWLEWKTENHPFIRPLYNSDKLLYLRPHHVWVWRLRLFYSKAGQFSAKSVRAKLQIISLSRGDDLHITTSADMWSLGAVITYIANDGKEHLFRTKQDVIQWEGEESPMRSMGVYIIFCYSWGPPTGKIRIP